MVGWGGGSEGGCIGEEVVWVNSFLVLDGLKKKLKVTLRKTFFGDTFLMKSETVHC